MTANRTYLVHLLAPDTFQLEDSTTKALETLTAPSGLSLSALTSANPVGQQVDVPDPAVGGLQDDHVYYVVKVDANTIRLVPNANEVAGAHPVALTALGTGTQSIGTENFTNGIGVSANLVDEAEGSSSPAIGSSQPGTPKEQVLSAVNAIKSIPSGLKTLFGSAGATAAAQPAMDNNGSTAGTTPAKGNDTFSAAGAVTVEVVNHTVQALVGAATGDTMPVVLATPQSITITATTSDSIESEATASVSKPNGSEGNAYALSITVAVVSNTALATIGPVASVDAGQSLTVASDVEYPFLYPIATYIALDFAPTNFTQDDGSSANYYYHRITTFLTDGSVGLADNELNDFVLTQANTQQAASESIAISGSIGVNVFDNTSHATIESGAKINQDAAFKTPAQSVAVTATTNVQLVDVAGIGSLGISVTGIASAASQSASNLKDPSTYVNPFGTGGGKSLGGSILATSITDNTRAIVDPGALIHIGAAGTLAVAANEVITRIEIATAGGSTGSGGTLAFAGSGLGYRERSETDAELESGTAGGASVTGGGAVSVTAASGFVAGSGGQPDDVGLQVGIAGSVAKAGTSATAIGVSVLVNDIQRNTIATIGPDATALGTTPGGTTNIQAGSLVVDATTGGPIFGIGAAGVVLSGQPAPPKSPTSATNGASLPPLVSQSGSAPSSDQTTSGLGIAGSALVNVVVDNTTADIDTAGTIDSGTLSVHADNSASEVLFSGAVAITGASASGAKGGTHIGGAFALNLITDDTEAHANTATYVITGPVGTAPTLGVIATMEGTNLVLSAALSADASTSGKDFAGSVSINRIVDTTTAGIDSATVQQASAVAVTATNAVGTIAVGGGIAATAGATGIGASIGFNQIAAQTTAEVTGNTRRSSLMVGSLTIDAENDNIVTAVAISAGVATGAQGNVAGAFTLGVNIISTSPSIFSSSNGDGINATIDNAMVNAGGAVTLTATDNSVIQSLAGAVGFGTKANAFGVGLSWNEVVLDVGAAIHDATVMAASVSLLSQSTQNAGLIGDKISTLGVGGAVSGTSNAVGASVAVNGVQNTITALIDDGASVTASGDIDVAAADTATIGLFEGGAGIAPTANGVGVGAGGSYIDNVVQAEINGATGDSTTADSTGGNVSDTAIETGKIESIVIGLGGGLNVGVAASLSAGVITDHVTAQIGDDADVTAASTVTVRGTDKAGVSIVAGEVAAGGQEAVGASLVNATVLDSNVATISGLATVAGTDGVVVDAETGEKIGIVAVGGALGGKFGVGGSATVTVINDNTTASIGAAANPRTPGTPTVTSATGDVDVTANGTVTILGTAGALAIGGTAGIGAGADVGVVTLTTTASIGADALVTASLGNVEVEAKTIETILSISVTGAGGGTAGIAGSAGISVVDFTTHAFIDSGATVTGGDNVVVQAEDDTTETQVAGSIGIGGTVGVGVAAAIGDITKDTQSWIATRADVTAKADGAAITADTGDVALTDATDPVATPKTVSFATSDVAANGEITAPAHGFSTGQAVIYSSSSVPLQGLQDGTVYYVIADSANAFRLADSAADAEGGVAISVAAGMSPGTGENQVQLFTDAGVPDASSKAFNGAGLLTNPFGAPATAAQQGVVVIAVSTNNLQNAGGAGAGAGTVAVAVAGTVAVDSITTIARVDAGASIVSGANVAVKAGRSYREVALGLGAAGSGMFAATPGFAVPVLTGTTGATISGSATQVKAAGNVLVEATARESIAVIAVGVAGAGLVGIGGSGAVVDVHTTVQALIDGATVEAGNNVAVQAEHISTGYAVAGAVGIGLAGGGGAGAVALTLAGSTDQALIDDGAVVDADANGAGLTDVFGATYTGVGVQALTEHTVFDIAGSGAGGLYAGIAGAVDVEQVKDSTTAAIESGAKVDTNDGATASAAQQVDVGALDQLTETAVAGALGVGGGAGVGAGVDVNIDDNTAQAYIGAATVAALGTVAVDGQSIVSIDTNALAVGAAGVGAIGGGVAVLSIGSGLTGSYGATNTDSGSSRSGNALAGQNATVLDSLNAAINSGVAGLTTPSGSTLPAFDPATAVSGNEIILPSTSGLNTGDTVRYSSDGDVPIGGLVDGGIYFVIVVDSTHIELAATQSDAVAGNAITLNSQVATGTSNTLAHSPADTAAMAQGQAAAAAPSNPAEAATLANPIAAGTTAAIDGDSTVTATGVTDSALQTMSLTVFAGGVGVAAGGAIGVGVGVVNVQANVSAYVGPGSVIDARGGAGSLSVTANRAATMSVLGIAGSGSGFVSLGSAVASVSDTSIVSALLGANVDGAGHVTGAAPTADTDIGSFGSVAVSAIQSSTTDFAVGAAAVSGVLGLGAAVAVADADTTTQAVLGDNANIGVAADPAGAVSVTATSTQDVEPYLTGQPVAIALSGAGLSGAAGVAEVTLAGATSADVGLNDTIDTSGAFTVTATGTDTSTANIDGAALGAIGIGTVIASVTATPSVTVSVGDSSNTPAANAKQVLGSSTISAASATIGATATISANANGTPAAGGVLAGSGGVITATADPTVATTVDTVLAAAGLVSILTTDTVTGASVLTGGDGGLISIGDAKANVAIGAAETTTIGGNARIDGETVDVEATGTTTANDQSTSSGGGLASVNEADTTVTQTDDTSTNVDVGAQLAAGGTLTVGTTSSMTGQSDPTANSYGFGGGVTANAVLTANQTAATAIDVLPASTARATGAVTQLQGGVLDVFATLAIVNDSTSADANADGAATNSVTSANTTANASGTIDLGPGARLVGDTQATFAATAPSVIITASGVSNSNGAVPVASTGTTDDPTVKLDVKAEAGSQVQTESLLVQSNGENDPTTTHTGLREQDGIDTNDTPSFAFVYDRTIEWNAAIQVLSPNPSLYVTSTGAIDPARTVGVTTQAITGGLLVAPIVNDPTGNGNLDFQITPSAYDSQNGTGGVTTEAVLSGVSAITDVSSFETVTITNNSTLNLTLSGIEPQVNTSSLSGHVIIDVPNGGNLFQDTISTASVPTVITIDSTNPGGGDIGLQGLIDDPLGSTTITAAGGSITEAAPGALIHANAVTLSALGSIGASGTNGTVLIKAATAVDAAASLGAVYLSQSGNLFVGTIAAATTASLSASDDIQQGSAASRVSGANIVLSSQLGAIGGSASGALQLDNKGQRATLTASAENGINVSGGAGGLALASLTTASGNITVTDPDVVNVPGQDITLGATALVDAVAGDVTLNAGDNLSMAPGAVIDVSGTVTIDGNLPHQESTGGTTISLTDGIIAHAVTVAGGTGANVFNLIGASTPTTISTGSGTSTVDIGSNALAANTGGTLRRVAATIDIDGGGTVNLDDSGETANQAGTFKGGKLTGLGMPGSITVNGAHLLNIKLGSGAEALAIDDTPATLTTALALGAGQDAISVGTGALSAIMGPVVITGGAGAATLAIDDHLDSKGTGTLATGGLTGFGVTPAAPTQGIAWTGLSQVAIRLAPAPRSASPAPSSPPASTRPPVPPP